MDKESSFIKYTNGICSLCFPGSKDIAKLTLIFWIAKAEKGYCLTDNFAHAGDEYFWFPDKPYSDPLKNMSDEEINALSDDDPKYIKSNKAYEKVRLWNLELSPEKGYKLYKDCLENADYDPEVDGYNFELWLFFKCGELIEEYENKNGIL
jgi:hypothetical protein